MEFFIFILILSLISFSVAFLAYGFCLRFFGAQGTRAKVAQIIITPVAVVLWDFLVITRNDISRAILGALPVIAVICLVVYSKLNNSDEPEPLELAPRKTSVKSMRAAEKRRQRAQRQEAAHRGETEEHK